MPLYAFELGRETQISLTELNTILKTTPEENNNAIALYELPDTHPLSKTPQEFQNRLGGTIKCIKILKRQDLANFDKNQVHESLEEILTSRFENEEGKIPFAINFYGLKKFHQLSIKKTLIFSKKFLKKLGFNSRFTNKNFKNVNSATVYKAQLIEKGIDLSFIKFQETLYIGKTIAIQDLDQYSKRDFDKPIRDAKIGMLPPKLAQILINLAGESETILDPFCGTGTILMEGLLMNKKVIGSDHNPRMVEASETNCQWLTRHFDTKSEYQIFEADARFLKLKKDLGKIDAVVTEGYLGETFDHSPSSQEIEKNFRVLANLHFNWLSNVVNLINSGSKVVTCVAGYQVGKKIIHLPDFEKIAKLSGFTILNQLTYKRSDQNVVRDIYTLEKKH